MTSSKKCPKCAELVKSDAVVCKHCGFKFGTTGGLLLNVIMVVAAILFLGYLFGFGDNGNNNSSTSIASAMPALDAEARAGCNKALDEAANNKIVLDRPSLNRVNVEDLVWSGMAAEDKRALLALVACDAFGKREGELSIDQHVVAYGHRSGKRLAILTSVGTQFE